MDNLEAISPAEKVRRGYLGQDPRMRELHHLKSQITQAVNRLAAKAERSTPSEPTS